MAGYLHGSTELQAHAAAAKELAEAKRHLLDVRATMWMYTGGEGQMMSSREGDERWLDAVNRVKHAKLRLAEAYETYTNPFGVVKHV